LYATGPSAAGYGRAPVSEIDEAAPPSPRWTGRPGPITVWPRTTVRPWCVQSRTGFRASRHVTQAARRNSPLPNLPEGIDSPLESGL